MRFKPEAPKKGWLSVHRAKSLRMPYGWQESPLSTSRALGVGGLVDDESAPHTHETRAAWARCDRASLEVQLRLDVCRGGLFLNFKVSAINTSRNQVTSFPASQASHTPTEADEVVEKPIVEVRGARPRPRWRHATTT